MKTPEATAQGATSAATQPTPTSVVGVGFARVCWEGGAMAPQNEPVDLVVKRDEGVTVTYADGHVATFELVELRHACPCATCRSLRDLNDELWPRPSSPIPLTISDAEMHGAWGLNITWNDGHATGIYPFDALRRWSDNGRPVGREYGEPVNPLNEPIDAPRPDQG